MTDLAFRDKIMDFEECLASLPNALFGGTDVGDAACPLKHTFTDGLYIRQITMPKGMTMTSKIHKTEHPYFVLRGDVTVATETGAQRIIAPYWGITKPGTKRALYMHEETVWITVHKTKETDLDIIEDQLIAKNFKELECKESPCLGSQ